MELRTPIIYMDYDKISDDIYQLDKNCVVRFNVNLSKMNEDERRFFHSEYRYKSRNKGNKALDYPIGLITADEVAYAGGVWATTNTSYYLYTGQNYWTMSPSDFSGSYAYVFNVYSNGYLSNYGVDYTNGVRPVINLKADVTITGSGTSSNPYKVS